MKPAWPLFLLTLCAGAMAAVALADTPTTQPATQPGAIPGAGAGRFPTFGVALTAPPGWTAARETGGNQVARWVKYAPGTKTIVGVLVAETTPPTGRTLDEFVQTLAETNRCRAETQRTSVDGAPARRLTTTAAAAEPHPLAMIATEKRGVFHTLSVIGDGSVNYDADLEAFRAAWRWIDVEPAADHLELRADATNLPGGRLSVRLPLIARPERYLSEESATYYITDLTGPREELAIQIAQMPKDEETTPEQLRAAVFGSLQKRMDLAQALATAAVPGRANAWSSDFVEFKMKQPDGSAPARLVCYFLWVPRPDRAIFCQFLLHPDAAGSKDKYAAMVKAVTASLVWTDAPK